MSATTENSSKVAKGIFLWVPIGLVAASLGYYLVKQMPKKLPAISQALGANERPTEGGSSSGSSENRNAQSGNFNMSAMAAELDRRSSTYTNRQIANRGDGMIVSPVPPRELSGADSLLKPYPPWERQFAALLTSYSALPGDSDEKSQWQDKMRTLLNEQWERQQADQMKELQLLKKIEMEWESALRLRDANRDAIVESYIGEWMGWPDPLQWTQGTASSWDLSAVEERARFREALKAGR